ncbi:39S ribosomal protein L48, mitochondrial [Pitangus sulphuratus]|nr:39S ribosomal protein L48, mitochondrial [Pitangus sulphuratus]
MGAPALTQLRLIPPAWGLPGGIKGQDNIHVGTSVTSRENTAWSWESVSSRGAGNLCPRVVEEGAKTPKRKKERVQMKEINPGTEFEYGDVNIQMTSYDMCLVEHFAQYVHRLCNRLSIKVNESYAMPTKTNEVLFLEEKGSKMQVDAVLTTHQRVVQISGLSSTFAPILLEIIQSNQPEGVHLLMKQHTEADFKSRLKARPELEELLAQMS